MSSRAKLEAALLEAHARGDHRALVSLYAEAASEAEDPTERRFFLTQAYVFALDSGDPQAARLRQDLVALGGER